MPKKKKEQVVTTAASVKTPKAPKKKKEPTPEKIQAAVEKIEEPSENGERDFNEYANDEFFDKLLFTIELVRAGFEDDTTFEMIMALVSVISMVTSECDMPVEHLLDMIADVREIHDNDDSEHNCEHCHHEEESKDPQAN